MTPVMLGELQPVVNVVAAEMEEAQRLVIDLELALLPFCRDQQIAFVQIPIGDVVPRLAYERVIRHVDHSPV